jgi:hypothetical protein
MTQPSPNSQPPHLELLGAPEVRPFESALAETRARWNADVARHSGEHTVFADQRVWSIEDSASRD